MACNFSEPYENEKGDREKHVCFCDEENEAPHLSPVCCQNMDKENPALCPAVNRSHLAYTNAVEQCAGLIQNIASVADKNQRQNTKALEERAKDIAHWRGEIQALISKLRDETLLLDNLRKQVERALTSLQTPESINLECRTRRISRTGYDMIPDQVDESLFHEEKLCQDIRNLLTLTKSEIISQLTTNNICKVQLEFDWSDKHEAYQLEAINMGLRENGPTAFFPGATRLPANQSTPEHWMHYTKELYGQGFDVLAKSQALRARTENSLSLSAADLRTQANSVDLNFHKNISMTEHALQAAEQDLSKVLSEITIAETLQGKLETIARQVDLNTKVSQTRLFNRTKRPRAEQTRDQIQYSLIGEVTQLNADGCAIKQEMENADKTLQLLYKSRALLEDTVAVKRKSLYIDRERCLPRRSQFPDSTDLAGF